MVSTCTTCAHYNDEKLQWATAKSAHSHLEALLHERVERGRAELRGDLRRVVAASQVVRRLARDVLQQERAVHRVPHADAELLHVRVTCSNENP